MKKTLGKIKKKKADKIAKKQEEKAKRITNKTVAEYREEVISRGKRHKYPLQTTVGDLVVKTLILILILVVFLSFVIWIQLYKFKNTGDLAYRITNFLSLPVASVDGENVKYRDYLMYQRSTMTVLRQSSQEIGDEDRKFYNQQAMDRAVRYAFAEKIAREISVSVDDEAVESIIKTQQQNSGLSERAYESAVLSDTLGMTIDDFRRSTRATLLLQLVSFSIDEEAKQTADKVGELVKSGKNLEEISKELGDKIEYVPGVRVNKDNHDGGLTKGALETEKGKISNVLRPSMGDGYYFVSPKESDDSTVTYGYIRVPLREFDNRLEKLRNEGKIKYYIDME